MYLLGSLISMRTVISVLTLIGAITSTGCQSLEKFTEHKSAQFQPRNLFAQAGIGKKQVDARIQKTFAQLFYGDANTQAVYFPAGQNSAGKLAYIMDIANQDVRSEGMSYGMMISVQMNKKAEFDALWNWAMTYMYHKDPAHPAKGYFAWSLKSDGTAQDEMPAPDGEEYFVTALYFAAARWGDGAGIYNYTALAHQILTDMRHRTIITGPTGKGKKTATNLFDEQAVMVRFTPDGMHAAHTDASYHLPAFYEIWARVSPVADRPFWQQAAKVSRDYFYKAAHPKTGLTPDYGNFDGTPWAAPFRPESADFRYDAWRCAMNWSMDWAWWQADPRQIELSNRLQDFFLSQGLDKYQSLYSLEGKALGGGQTTGLVAMNAVASLAADHPERLLFVKALWNKPIPEGKYRYYDGMLYMFGLLHTSGKFRPWIK